jgi:hypothetical protein
MTNGSVKSGDKYPNRLYYDNESLAMFGRSRTLAIMSSTCVRQLQHPNKRHSMRFTDADSINEYRITGFCQTCQDTPYG